MKTLSERIDEKQRIDRIEKEKISKDEIQQQEFIEALIIKEFKEAADIVGDRLTMKKQHERMYLFFFDLSEKESLRHNKISSYIHTNDIFERIWEFNKNSETYFRSIKKIDIENLKSELIFLVEELVKEMKIL